MKKLITASIAAATLVAALPTLAAAAPTPPTVGPAVRGTRDAGQVGVSRVVAPKPKPAPATDESGIDRTFHPDYTNALSVQQASTAWNDEVIRVMEIPQNLGGG
jgi:hypothetical protein